tara:strand:- start:2287 stop:2511 length:225 start_codon:yes stop_codon:yes gene_type:complete
VPLAGFFGRLDLAALDGGRAQDGALITAGLELEHSSIQVQVDGDELALTLKLDLRVALIGSTPPSHLSETPISF